MSKMNRKGPKTKFGKNGFESVLKCPDLPEIVQKRSEKGKGLTDIYPSNFYPRPRPNYL